MIISVAGGLVFCFAEKIWTNTCKVMQIYKDISKIFGSRGKVECKFGMAMFPIGLQVRDKTVKETFLINL